ncbi:MAG: DUF4340 domain-containing protein [Deltaproteobacteria bacterium]|nr:DUF4340 domain-containing protein [Deltaproteobacteria bacterium]
MKNKKEYIILAATILALSLYLVSRSPDRTHYQLPKSSKIAKTDISKLEISTPDTSVILEKKDNQWHIAPEGYVADTDRVEQMLEVIEDLTVTALVSESKNYSRFNLDDDNKITVKAWAGDTTARDFEVGKTATSYRHTFVKLVNDDRVYHARGNFRSKFEQTVDKLRDKTVLSFDKSEIQEIRMTKGRQVVAFGRREVQSEVISGQPGDGETPPSPKVETVWQTADGTRANNSKLDRLLTTLSNLKCEKFINDMKKQDFMSPIHTIQLKGVEEHTLSIFAKTRKETENYPAVSSGSDYPFLLPERQVDDLAKDPDEFLKKP